MLSIFTKSGIGKNKELFIGVINRNVEICIKHNTGVIKACEFVAEKCEL